MILSHGSAAVESGFSISLDFLVENLHESSVVAQRQICCGICYHVGVLEV